MESKTNRILEALRMQPLSEEEKAARHILGRLYGPIATTKEKTRNGRGYNKELWEKANAVLQRRSDDVKGRQGICNHANLLTGKLWCTDCGAPYYRKESRDKHGNKNGSRTGSDSKHQSRSCFFIRYVSGTKGRMTGGSGPVM